MTFRHEIKCILDAVKKKKYLFLPQKWLTSFVTKTGKS